MGYSNNRLIVYGDPPEEIIEEVPELELDGVILDEIELKNIVLECLTGRMGTARHVIARWRRFAQRKKLMRFSEEIPERLPADLCEEESTKESVIKKIKIKTSIMKSTPLGFGSKTRRRHFSIHEAVMRHVLP